MAKPPCTSGFSFLLCARCQVLGVRCHMTRLSSPTLSLSGQQAIDQYMAYLLAEEDLSSSTVRNYLSDLRQFAAWCELTWEEGQEATLPFEPGNVSTPTITRYRSHLQSALKLKPATV